MQDHSEKVSVENRAIHIAKRYFAEQGYTVQDVARTRGHNGYVLLVSQAEDIKKVEVKGCSRSWQIPDLFDSEFDQDKRLMADILCVVYLIEGAPPSLCLIPRNDIPPHLVIPKRSYRISGRFKKQRVLEQYWIPMPFEDEAVANP